MVVVVVPTTESLVPVLYHSLIGCPDSISVIRVLIAADSLRYPICCLAPSLFFFVTHPLFIFTTSSLQISGYYIVIIITCKQCATATLGKTGPLQA
ncbi:uncharacterized protein K460DRAFT_54082 [Cucurbitaria berberidis CBS 394.84]|uniref:Uncharacterized protein n=1 Tax=Cucurbitaria berberidis CBS 394.84 TaxID=1168544 RepID=A0A9P4GKK2_9PLEO|nr:uncharacterized protein K460DRAFT_54082 [Cucurbitaria berberidis CBS 394.84]KAF1847139.1 hypothetical protein K460DRAFT_54082 [Cucurbitaria berberidis CBS 394.84]